MNICQVMIFKLYTVYNKHEMIKIDGQTREKSQVLSQVLEKFCCRLYYLKLTYQKIKILNNGKFSEDEQGEICIKCFSWTLP